MVLLVKDKDRDCLMHKGDINPFKTDTEIRNGENSRFSLENPVGKSSETSVAFLLVLS